MIAEATQIVLFDAFRFIAIGMGFILLAISGFGAYHAWRYGWPRRIQFGLVLLWSGRFAMVVFMDYFVYERLGETLNWFTPVIFYCFVAMVVGNFIAREQFHDMSRPSRAEDPTARASRLEDEETVREDDAMARAHRQL